MPRAKANTKQINVFLPAEAHEQIKKEAQQKGTTVSGLIRMIVLEYLRPKE